MLTLGSVVVLLAFLATQSDGIPQDEDTKQRNARNSESAEVNKPTPDDLKAVQAMLLKLVMGGEPPADDAPTPVESEASRHRKTTAFLVEAAKNGDLGAVTAALKAGVDPNGSPRNQLTALHWAVAKRISEGKNLEPSAEIAKQLIEAGANVNAKDYLGQSPLEWAATHATPAIVKMLIKAGADVNAESRYGTVLMAARRADIAKLLIEAGADVNAGKTMPPLANAAKYGNAELIRLLVKNGAQVNDPRDPPIHWAGKPEVAKALIDAGADVNQRNSKGETALHLAKNTWSPNAEAVKLLLEAGADVNGKNKSNSTPLHAAVGRGKPEIVNLLVAAGADVDAKDNQGNTPLSVARETLSWGRGRQNFDSKPYEVVVQLLADAGAEDDGRTKLQRAVASGKLEDVKKLISTGSDVNANGPQRITAAHIASEKGHAEILAALIEAGAKVDQMDARRMRPLHLAANAAIARTLIAKGAKVNSGVPTPLYMATMNGRTDVVRELVRNQANVKDSDCAKMLNWATFAGQINVIKVLFEERNAQTLLQESNYEAPLHIAASGSSGDMSCGKDVTPEIRLEIAALLVEQGADVDVGWGANANPLSGAAPMINTTPLMFASMKGEAKMVKFLLGKGADGKAANASGQTALHFAAQRGHHSVVELLLKAKVNVNAVTREAKTPLDLAQDAGVKVLLIQNGGKTGTELLKDSQREK